MGKTPKKNICTKCGLKVFPQDIRPHPTLGVVICSACYDSYVEVGDISRYWRGVDLDGTDNYCRWCLDGGEIILCNDEACHSSFCKNCIERNFGKARAAEIEQSSDWYCFVCDRTQLEHLRIKPAKKAPEKLSIKAPEKPSIKPPEKPSIKPPEKPSIEPPEKPNIKAPEKTSVKAPEKTSIKPPEKPSIEPPEKPNIKAPEKTSVKAPEKTSVKAPEKPSVKAPEKPSVKAPEKPSVKAPEKPSVKATEKPSVKAPEKPSVEAPEKPSIKAPEKPSVEAPEKPIIKAPEGATVRLTVRNPVISTEKIIDVPINKEPERPADKASEAPANGVSKPPVSDQQQPLPAQGTKRKLGRHLGIFSTSRICSKPKSEVALEVKKSLVEPVNNKPPIVEPINDKPSESNGTVSDKTIDLAAIEKELDISDNDSDFMDASEVPPMPINDATDVTENNPVWFPSTNADTITGNNNAFTHSGTNSDVVMIDVATKHDNLTVNSNQNTTAQDSDIFEALEAHKSSIESKVMGWVLKDADILKDRLEIHMKALQTAIEGYDKSKFIQNPKSLSSWASNLDSYMKESPAIRQRCYNLITHPNLNE